MQTPYRVTAGVFEGTLKQFLVSHCRLGDDLQLYCSLCGSAIQYTPVAISIHDIDFPDLCAGDVMVWKLSIPYCGACEPKPQECGCVHLPINQSQRVA